MVVIFKYIKTALIFIAGGFLFYFGGLMTKSKHQKKKQQEKDLIINNLKSDAKIKERISKLSFNELSSKLLSKQRSNRVK